jgi:hypothetical protein
MSMTNEFAQNENFDSSDQPELSEDNNLNPSIQVTFTQNHPMGQILLNLLKDTFKVAKKSNVKEMDSDIHELCTNFYNAMRMGKMNTSRQIKQSAKDLEDQLIEKELNGHLLHENTKPPKEFSPTPTLLNTHLRNEAMKCFPTKGPKFSGNPLRDGGMDIIEFLSALKTAQEYCNLSEKEFKQFLLLCTTGKAHALMIEWISLEESIPTIFHNLVMHFDKRLTPESAKELLFNYRAPKSLSLKEVETNIMLWVSRAATTLPAGPSRVAYYNMEIVQTLIRSLPAQSSARVQSVFNTLSARLGRAAQATELSRALNIDRHSIDLDIRRNGADRNQRSGLERSSKPGSDKERRSSERNKAKKNSSGVTYVIQAPTNTQGMRSRSNKRINTSQPRVYNAIASTSPFRLRSSSGQRQRNNPTGRHNTSSKMSSRPQSQNRNNFRNTSSSKIVSRDRNQSKHYCSLCGKKDHLASDSCPYMISDSGSRVAIMPTHSTCTLCPPHVHPRLNHPSSLCPYRRGGPMSKST